MFLPAEEEEEEEEGRSRTLAVAVMVVAEEGCGRSDEAEDKFCSVAAVPGVALDGAVKNVVAMVS